MELQQSNTSEPNPNGYKRLLDDEASSSPQARFNQEKLQETSSSIHQRASASEQDALNPLDTPKTPPPIKNRIQELDGYFGTFYKVLMIIFILMPGLNVVLGVASAIFGIEFDKFFVFVEGWGLVQNVLAFDGMRKRHLTKIEKALTMMKIHFVLSEISNVNKALELRKLRDRPESNLEIPPDAGFFVAGAISVTVYILLLLLPTIKVRNILKTVPQGYDHAYAEEIRREQDQDSDPIERLRSLPFKIYKFGLVIMFCWMMKSSVSLILEGLAKSEAVWEEMMLKSSFLILIVSGFSVTILRIVFGFLVFEGMRRRSLEKVEASIKIMRVSLGVEFLLSTMKEVTLYYEGKESQEIWSVMLSFLFQQLIFGLMYYFMFLYGALKARDILKAHQNVRRTL